MIPSSLTPEEQSQIHAHLLGFLGKDPSEVRRAAALIAAHEAKHREWAARDAAWAAWDASWDASKWEAPRSTSQDAEWFAARRAAKAARSAAWSQAWNVAQDYELNLIVKGFITPLGTPNSESERVP